MTGASQDAEYFERIYQAHPDPWGYAATEYEQRKYAATLAAIAPRRFRHGLEIGCSIGIFSHHLATICDRVLALDFSETALSRTTPHDRITFERRSIPADWPAGRFDLVVISEVLYYLSEPDLDRTVAATIDSLEPDGVVVLVNWLGETGVSRTGDEAADGFIRRAASRLQATQALRTERYRLDLLTHRPAEAS